MPVDDRLRLIALDVDDLAIISTHIQDAVVKVADMHWLAKEGRFAMALNRFAWEVERRGLFRRGPHQRRRSALHFERVESIRTAGFNMRAKDQVLALLAVVFEPTNEPSGEIVLVFSGDALIRLRVECLEAQLADLGPVWSTIRAPRHRAV